MEQIQIGSQIRCYLSVTFFGLRLNRELVIFCDAFLSFRSPNQVRIRELGLLLKNREFLIFLENIYF